jgi:hypothetical protein
VTSNVEISAKVIGALAERIDQVNKANGFNDEDTSDPYVAGLQLDRRLLLAVGELIEAQEELRSGHAATEVYYKVDKNGNKKPEGFGPEVADAIIRLLHLCYRYDIPIGDLIEEKLAYNATRGYKHGGRVF